MNQVPARHGEPWDEEEARDLLRAFQDGATLMQLIKKHQRSPVVVQLKLEKLGHTNFTRYNKDFWPGAIIPPVTPPTGRVVAKITGRFWMIQNANVSDRRDGYGHATLHWPGRSIYERKAEAVEAAKDLAERNPSDRFFVMEAVSMFETEKPPVKCTTFRK